MKKLLLTILFIFILQSSAFAYISQAEVAIVGNSLATQMSNTVDVDNDYNTDLVSNHGCAGDTIWSRGFSTDMDGYKKGSFADNISSFQKNASDYSLAVMFFGSNEICGSLQAFIDQYENFIKKCLEGNNRLQFVICSIPYRESEQFYVDTKKIDEWNSYLYTLTKDSRYNKNLMYFPTQELPLASDGVHISRDGYKQLWQTVKTNYKVVR